MIDSIEALNLATGQTRSEPLMQKKAPPKPPFMLKVEEMDDKQLRGLISQMVKTIGSMAGVNYQLGMEVKALRNALVTMSNDVAQIKAIREFEALQELRVAKIQ